MVSHHEIILSARAISPMAGAGHPAAQRRRLHRGGAGEPARPGGRVGLRASLAQPVSIASGTDTRARGKAARPELFNRLRSASRQLGLAGGRIEEAPAVKNEQELVEDIRRAAEARAGAQAVPAHPAPVQPRGDGGALRYPGEPRIDPQRVEGAGMVIRRLVQAMPRA